MGGAPLGGAAGGYMGAQKAGLKHVASTAGKTVEEVKRMTKAQRLAAAPTLAAGGAGREGLRGAIRGGIKGGALKGALAGGIGLLALKKIMN